MSALTQAGAMREPVTLKQRTQTRGDSGGFVETWADYGNVFARKMEQSATEIEKAGQDVSTQRVMWHLYYDGNVNARDFQLVWNGRVYDIIAVKELGYRNMMELQTEVRDNE